MSSSRSDVVTKCVRSFVCSCVRLRVRPFFSFSGLGVYSAVFSSPKGCLSVKDVKRKFKGWFKEVSRVFTENCMGVSRKLKGCFKKVSRVFQWCHKRLSRVFQGDLMGVSWEF